MNRLRSLCASCFAAWLCLLFAVATGAAQPATAGPPRYALLIANSAYPETVPPLVSPSRSAQALAEELRRSHFEVEVRENLGRDAMRKALDAFMAKLVPGSAGLLFFSGFGIAAGQNYLVPIDVQLWTEADVKRDAFGLDAILREMEVHGATAKFVVLDASRRNPFERRFRSLSAGLNAIEAPRGSLIMSAAAPGRVIPDNEGDTSLFVGELVKEMRAPDRGAEDIFNRTRIGVISASKNEQAPQIAMALTEDFSLRGRCLDAGAAHRTDRGDGRPDGQCPAAGRAETGRRLPRLRGMSGTHRRPVGTLRDGLQ